MDNYLQNMYLSQTYSATTNYIVFQDNQIVFQYLFFEIIRCYFLVEWKLHSIQYDGVEHLGATDI
jgi:hypothetical protein